ncbi:MAG: HlyC/CorC family transporter [Bacteroidaceae bacterium]|nr:HlyC/CorC family transporter [Bacteroidaceae bacterium]MBP3613626.1 HlyC/CorC family transporter [Bacteroidaceae bacterium]
MTDIILLIVVILFSALFSGMEIAFVASNKLLMGIDMNNRTITSFAIDKFYSNSNNFVSSLLVGNNIVLVIYGILMAKLLNATILSGITDSTGVRLFLETLISTIIIILTGEFVPKAIFRINPNGALKRFALIMYPIYILLYPLARFTTWVSCLILRLFNIRINKETRDNTFSKTELNNLIQSSIDNAKKEEEEIDNDVRIFQNVLDFSDIKVRDCFVPRTEIYALEVTATLEELKSMFIESGHSKIIVYKDNIDNIIGYIHSSELFRSSEHWQQRICKMPIVPETLSAQKLLRTLMQQKKSLAVVVDEFGGTSGIISLEDLLEEIIGEIEDEHDNTNLTAKALDENEYLLSGRLEVERINEMFELEIPESDEYQTLGGFILSHHQRFPKLNETITIENFSIQIIKQRSMKIELVKLKVLEEDKD